MFIRNESFVPVTFDGEKINFKHGTATGRKKKLLSQFQLCHILILEACSCLIPQSLVRDFPLLWILQHFTHISTTFHLNDWENGWKLYFFFTTHLEFFWSQHFNVLNCVKFTKNASNAIENYKLFLHHLQLTIYK